MLLTDLGCLFGKVYRPASPSTPAKLILAAIRCSRPQYPRWNKRMAYLDTAIAIPGSETSNNEFITILHDTSAMHFRYHVTRATNCCWFGSGGNL